MIKRVLLGIAVGDAFGSGIEGQDKEWIGKNVDFTKYVSVRTGPLTQGRKLGDFSDTCDTLAVFRTIKGSTPSPSGYKLGDYSDDTCDTLATFRTIKQLPITAENLLAEIKKEYDTSKKERGGIPRDGYGSISWYFEGTKTLQEVQDYQRNKTYPGNAPVMRSIPFGILLQDDQINSACIINADVTHPHPKARVASILIARAAQHLLVLKLPQSNLISSCRKFVLGMDPETDSYLEKVDQLPNSLDSFENYCFLVGPQPIKSFMTGEMIIGLNSDAMRTAGTALHLLKFCKTPFEALRRSILVGGDVDTLASIVVGIVCGMGNEVDLPNWMFEQLEHVNELTEFADKF